MPKTAFSVLMPTKYGSFFEFLVLPFGVTNAVGFFFRVMDIVLKGLFEKKVSCYLDDVQISSKTFDEHLATLRLVFGHFRSHQLKLNAA